MNLTRRNFIKILAGSVPALWLGSLFNTKKVHIEPAPERQLQAHDVNGMTNVHLFTPNSVDAMAYIRHEDLNKLTSHLPLTEQEANPNG